MKPDENDKIQTGAAEFKTVKAGCGIRFDPDTLDEEAGFDFSQAEKLKPEPKKVLKTSKNENT
tara:strand:+ start:3511 stop:3699 length:189 start_codon:yes stop_codon:yes gene_type:complete